MTMYTGVYFFPGHSVFTLWQLTNNYSEFSCAIVQAIKPSTFQNIMHYFIGSWYHIMHASSHQPVVLLVLVAPMRIHLKHIHYQHQTKQCASADVQHHPAAPLITVTMSYIHNDTYIHGLDCNNERNETAFATFPNNHLRYISLRVGCTNAQLTIWLANRGLTLS